MFILRPGSGFSNHRHLVCVTWINHRLIGMEGQPPVRASVAQDFADELQRTTRRDDRELIDLGRRVIQRLAGETSASEPDARVRKIVAWAQAQLDNPIGLGDAAKLVGLSKPRLRHLS